MAATPPPSPFSSPAGFVERRSLPDRRAAERRSGALIPSDDRRAWSDRRHPVPRRETSAGHLRNALQTLTLLGLANLREEERQALRAAGERLWLALYEIQRPSARPSDPPSASSGPSQPTA
jgi:hypothetical protein